MKKTQQRVKKDSRLLFGEAMLMVLAVSALYVILSGHYAADAQKWAYGVLGSVLTASIRFLK